MRYKVTLTNPVLGSLILEKEPKGLKDIAPNLKRGENHGVSEEIDVKLEFYCGAGKEFIDQVREEQGIDGEILIDIDAACGCDDIAGDSLDYSIDYTDDYGSQGSEGCDYEDFYEGRLDLKTWDSKDPFTSVDIIPDGILQTVKNRLDTKVDLFKLETIEGTALEPFTYGPYDLTLHSKELILQSQLALISNDSVVSEGPNSAGSDFVFHFPLYAEAEELQTTSIPDDVISCDGNTCEKQPLFTNDSGVTQLTVEYRVKGRFRFFRELVGNQNYEIDVFAIRSAFGSDDTENFQTIFDETPGQFTLGDDTLIGPEYIIDFDVSGTDTYSAVNGDKFYLWLYLGTQPFADNNYYFVIENLEGTYIYLSGQSTTEATTAKAFGIFEAGAQIARVITDQEDAFRSSYFGRKNSEPYSYSSNGCGSFRSTLNGFMVRGFPITGDFSRSIRMSMNDYFKGLNAIDNLGMTVEKTGDDYHIVIERKEYFYDSSNVILTLNNVPDIKRSEAPEYYYNRIDIGYEKWETEFINGLDEPNSKRQFDTGIKAVNNPLEVISNLVASAYRLEVSRRKQYAESFTEDSEYDEDNFIVCLNHDLDESGNPLMTEAEKDERFTQVNNLLSPETSYNLDITPERNYLRWNSVINAGLTKYPGREVRFTSGEGNYKIESEFTDNDCPGSFNNNLLQAGQDLQWDSSDNLDKDPIWLPEYIEFEYPLTWTQYKTVKTNSYGVIEVSDNTEDHIKGYILDLKYKPGGLTTFKLLRAFE